MAAATAAVQRGEWETALQLLEQVDALRQGPDSRRLRAICHLMQRDFASAWRDYHQHE